MQRSDLLAIAERARSKALSSATRLSIGDRNSLPLNTWPCSDIRSTRNRLTYNRNNPSSVCFAALQRRTFWDEARFRGKIGQEEAGMTSVDTNPFESGLDKNAANYVPLTPIGFLRRSASVYPARLPAGHRR